MPSRHTRDPYTCPRCEYITSRKADMKKHLYGLQALCPAKNNLELTDTIKSHVMTDRIYHPPPKQTAQQVLIQNIQQNNIIQTYIAKMDNTQKLEHYLQHIEAPLIDYLTSIETKYEKQIKKLQTKSRPFRKYDTLNLEGFINVLDNCTLASHVQEMNVMYDKVLDKIKIFEGEWENHLFKYGVKELIEKIQEVYLDYYEEHLLRQYTQASGFDKQCVVEALKEYYEFLECFDVAPRLTESDEEWIQGLNDESVGQMLRAVRDDLKASKLKDVKKMVYDVIKKNCTANALDLNNKMMDLIKMDEGFKTKIIDRLQGGIVSLG